MNCYYCGSPVPQGGRFCQECGKEQPVMQAPSQVQNQYGGQQQYGAQGDPFDISQLAPPRGMTPLKTNRSLLMYILLCAVTCGIYSFFFIYRLAEDINAACAGDGSPAIGGLGEYIGYTLLTCGVYSSCWNFNLNNRIKANGRRYGINIEDDGTSILIWSTVGMLLCGLGPFIAMHKMCRNANAICEAYNRYNNLA